MHVQQGHRRGHRAQPSSSESFVLARGPRLLLQRCPYLHERLSIPCRSSAGRDLLGRAFGNWQVSGFCSQQSGLALSPGLSTSTRGQATRPNATGASVDGPQTVLQWFNTAAFVAPQAGFYGNAGRGTIEGPGFAMWDSAASKQWPIKDQMRLSFKGEFFNFLNHTNFLGVSTSLGSGTYGRVTSARDPRKIQLSMRFEF